MPFLVRRFLSLGKPLEGETLTNTANDRGSWLNADSLVQTWVGPDGAQDHLFEATVQWAMAHRIMRPKGF
jgi:hypothetical protein